jgi:hypothetical protein
LKPTLTSGGSRYRLLITVESAAAMQLKRMPVVLVGLLPLAAVGRAQDPKPTMPKGQVPELGRPTKVDDALTPFSFDDYFPGSVVISVSEDGGPFRNYGNPWWRKDASATNR